LPDYDDCLKHNWGLYYFSFDVSYTFESLYTNRHGLLDKFEQYWVQVAKTFVDNKYVIGYEIINEPFAGSPWKNPAVIVPSVAEMVHLQRFYDRISTAIRKVDKSHPICFEPVTWDNTVPVGFTHPPGGKRYQNESILCYHFYMPPSINLKAIKARVNDAKRLGISSILSEFWYKSDNAAEVIN
jgi:endoglycosylceramidase